MGKKPPQNPTCQSLLICDGIHRDQGTGKYYILGTFRDIGTRQLPARVPLMCVFVVLTDGMGPTPICVKLVYVGSEEHEQELATASGEIVFEDPRMVAELALPLGSIQFDHFGEYRVQLFAADDLLLESRLLVIEIK